MVFFELGSVGGVLGGCEDVLKEGFLAFDFGAVLVEHVLEGGGGVLVRAEFLEEEEAFGFEGLAFEGEDTWREEEAGAFGDELVLGFGFGAEDGECLFALLWGEVDAAEFGFEGELGGGFEVVIEFALGELVVGGSLLGGEDFADAFFELFAGGLEGGEGVGFGVEEGGGGGDGVAELFGLGGVEVEDFEEAEPFGLVEFVGGGWRGAVGEGAGWGGGVGGG